MKQTSPVSFGAALLAAASVVAVCTAQQPAPTGVVASRSATAARAARGLRGGVGTPRATNVVGYAWTSNQAPIADATVRLRNILTGKIEAVVRAASDGKFVFDAIEGGNYVVEILDSAGRVLAVGETFSAFPGDSVVTFVRLTGKLPAAANLFSNAAASVVSSAASTGITAVAPVAQAVSP